MHKIIEDTKYLKSVDDIEGYFKEDGYTYFDCGQGYYSESEAVYIKIDDKYYEVIMTAEIGSQKQDRGDRLYWVEGIKSVTYKELSKEGIDLFFNNAILRQISGYEKEIEKLKSELI